MNRIVDIISVFESDLRIQLAITSKFSDPFIHDLPALISAAGIRFIGWKQATARSFDLIVSASHHGDLHELRGPIVIFSHGLGYSKYAPQEPGARSQEPGARSQEPGARSQEPGARSQEPGARSQEPGARSVFGLSRPWLVNGRELIAAALIFAHPEQLDRLSAAVPEALETAVLAGDPCFDRMLESLRFRSRFRAALGVGDDRKIVVVSSTWSSNSMLGAVPELVRRLMAALPVDEFQVALIPHPNIWNRHGPGQLQSWFADAVRAGLILIPPDCGWQAALIAADCVIGDQGSVSAYGAALDRPTLLAVFAPDEVVPGTAVAALGRLAPQLQPYGSLRRQVQEAIDSHVPGRFAEVASLTSAVPGESPQRLRRLCYRILDLPEPPGEAVLQPLTTAGLAPHAGPRAAAMLVFTEWEGTTAELRLERFAADTRPFVDDAPHAAATHTVVHHEHPVRGLRHGADVVFGLRREIAGAPVDWLAETLAEHPSCTLAALVTGRSCMVRHRDGEQAELRAEDSSDASILSSIAYAWKASGRTLADLPERYPVRLGGRPLVVTVRRAGHP
jgi:hypothetical protein